MAHDIMPEAASPRPEPADPAIFDGTEGDPADGTLDGEVGARIRAIRKDLALSLQQVADRAAVSVGTLSQLERGLSQPSLRTLHKICAALGVPLAWLFQTASTDPATLDSPHVVRAGRGARQHCPAEGYDKFLLSPQNLDGLQLIRIRLAPQAQSGPGAYTHPGLDAGFVLTGSLHLEIGGQLNVLTAGDSFAFSSAIPHRFENRGATTAEIIWVTTQSAASTAAALDPAGGEEGQAPA